MPVPLHARKEKTIAEQTCVPDRMRAARLVDRGQIRCEHVPVPELGAGPALLVRTLRAQVCGSDVHAVYHGLGGGRMLSFPCHPGFPGHESVGRVVRSSGATGLDAGRLVLAVPDPPAAAAFAEYQVLHPDFVVPLRDGIDVDAIALAQQLGTVMLAVKRFWPWQGGDCATVIGAGSAGLLFLQRLKAAGFERVIVSDLEAGRLARAERLGARLTVHAPAESVVSATLDATGGRGADLVVEASGSDSGRAAAIDAVATDGRIGFFGLPHTVAGADLSFAALFRRRATVDVSWGAQREPGLASFRAAVEAIDSGAIDVASIVSHVFPIEAIGDALALAASRREDALKVAIDFPPA